MASKWGVINARNVLGLSQRGESVPLNIEQAAVRVLQGGGSSGDEAALKRFLGIRRNGASGVRGLTGMAGTLTRPVQNLVRSYEQVADVAARGGSTTQANIRFIQTIQREFTGVLRTKAAKWTADTVAKTIRKSEVLEKAVKSALGIQGAGSLRGANILSSMRGLLSMGSAALGVGAVAAGAWQAGEEYFKRRGAVESARGRMYDMSRQIGGSRSLSRMDDVMSRQILSANQNIYSKALSFLGINKGLEDSIAQMANARKQTRANARDNARLIGVDVGAVLARVAAKRGRSIDQLTEQERLWALDEAIKSKLNQQDFRTQATRRAAYEMWWAKRLSAVFFEGGAGAALEQRIQEHLQKLEEGWIRSKVEWMQLQKDQAESKEKSGTGAQKAKQVVINEIMESAWAAHRARHKAFAND